MVEHAKAMVLSHYGLDGVGLAYVDEVLAGAWRWIANAKGKWLGKEGVPIRDRYAAHMDNWMEASRTIFDLEVLGLGDQRCRPQDVWASNQGINGLQHDVALSARCAARSLARATAMAQVDPEGKTLSPSWIGEVGEVFRHVVRAQEEHTRPAGRYERTGRRRSAGELGQAILVRVKPWVEARAPGEWEVPPP